MKTFLQLLVWMLLAAAGGAYGAEPGSELTGQWRGALAVDAKTSLTIQLDIAKRPDGVYLITLDSPDNGAIKNTPASKVSVDGGKLSFEVPSLSGAYAGTVKAGSIAGEWKQPTGALPLTFTPYKAPQLSKAAIDTLKGGWVGTAQLPGVTLAMVMNFRLDDKGGLAGTLRSPDQGGGEAAMTNVEFKDNLLTARVPVGFADITLKLDGDTFTGKIKQPNGPPDGLNLTLKRGEYVAPVFPLNASDETRTALAGKWSGLITPPAGAPGPGTPRPVTVTFRRNDKNQFVGAIEFGGPAKQEFAVQDLLLNGTKLMLKAGPGGAMQYNADLAGKTLTGEWSVGPNKLPLVLTRN